MFLRAPLHVKVIGRILGKGVILSFECVGPRTHSSSRTAERGYFKFRVCWATDSSSVTYVCTLLCSHLARLLENLN